jgi:hypothetical protein
VAAEPEPAAAPAVPPIQATPAPVMAVKAAAVEAKAPEAARATAAAARATAAAARARASRTQRSPRHRLTRITSLPLAPPTGTTYPRNVSEFNNWLPHQHFQIPPEASTCYIKTTQEVPPAATTYAELSAQVSDLLNPGSPWHWTPTPSQCAQIATRSHTYGPVGGCSSNRWERWQEMFPTCSWIHQIRTGAPVKLTRPREHINFHGRPTRMNSDPEIAARDRAVVLQMLAKCIIRPMTADEKVHAMLHPHFWREKKHKLGPLPYNGSILQALDANNHDAVNTILKTWRLIMDFKRGLNQFTQTIRFRANGLTEAMALTQRHDMTSYMDVTEAYYNDLIATLQQHLLGFLIQDPLLLRMAPHGFCFRTLCFGYSDAPRQFIRKHKLPLEWVRSCGIRTSDVMDDVLCLAQSILGEDPQANNLRHLMVLCIVWEFLGYRLQVDKAGFIPSVTRAFAGGFIFTTLLWIDMIPEKRDKHVQKVLNMLDTIKARGSSQCHALATPRELLSISNTVTSSRQMISHPKLHMSHTRKAISEAQQRKIGWDQWIPVPRAVTLEWKHFTSPEFNFWRGKRFNLGPPDWIVAGDASGRMIGGCIIDPNTMLPDPTKEPISMLIPNYLNGIRLWDGHSTKTEPAARVLLSYQFAVRENWWNGLQMYLGDNTTSESTTNKEGGRKHAINMIMATFEPFFRARRLTHRQTYTPGQKIIDLGVDELSRTGKLSKGMTEIVVRNWVYKQLLTSPAPTLDLFASMDNHKCKTWWTRHPSPEADAINTLTQPLSRLPPQSYAFPPTKVIQTLLQKFRDEAPHTCKMLVLVPHWRGQPWYPLFLQLLCSPPTLIPLDQHHFQHPLSHKELTKGWCMISANLSPNPAVTAGFRLALRTALPTVSGREQVRLITTPYAHSSTFSANMVELGATLERLT